MSDDIVWRLEGEGSPRALCGAPPLLIEAADEIKRLRAREARLKEALNQYSCGCSGPCWYPKDSPSCGLKARTALGEEKKG